MKVLILTGKFGMGHWSAARSLAEQLEAEGHTVTLLDFFDFALPELSSSLYRGFNFLVTRMGGLYNFCHRLTRNVRGEVPMVSLLIRSAPVWCPDTSGMRTGR